MYIAIKDCGWKTFKFLLFDFQDDFVFRLLRLEFVIVVGQDNIILEMSGYAHASHLSHREMVLSGTGGVDCVCFPDKRIDLSQKY